MATGYAYVPSTSDGRTIINYSHPEDDVVDTREHIHSKTGQCKVCKECDHRQRMDCSECGHLKVTYILF